MLNYPFIPSILFLVHVFWYSVFRCIHVYTCCIYFMNWCLSLVTIFVLKSFFSAISINSPALFCLPFVWHIFFHPFTFSLLCLWIYTSVPCVPSIELGHFLSIMPISSFNLKVYSFLFNVITDKVWFTSVNWCLHFMFLVFFIVPLFFHYCFFCVFNKYFLFT